MLVSMYYFEYKLLFITQELKVAFDFLIFCHRGPSFRRFLSMEQKILLGDLVFKYLQLSEKKKIGVLYNQQLAGVWIYASAKTRHVLISIFFKTKIMQAE